MAPLIHYYVNSVVAASATPPHYQIMEEKDGKQVCIAMVPFNKHVAPQYSRDAAFNDARLIADLMNAGARHLT